MNISESVISDTFIATNGLQTNIETYRGQWIVLYFYPKDATSGCCAHGEKKAATDTKAPEKK